MPEAADKPKDSKAMIEATQNSLNAAALRAKNEVIIQREQLRQLENMAAFAAGRASGYSEGVRDATPPTKKKEGE